MTPITNMYHSAQARMNRLVPDLKDKSSLAQDTEYQMNKENIVQGARKAQVWRTSAMYVWWGSLGALAMIGGSITPAISQVVTGQAAIASLGALANPLVFGGIAFAATMMVAAVTISSIAKKLERTNDVALHEHSASRTAKHIAHEIAKTQHHEHESLDQSQRNWKKFVTECAEQNAQRETALH